MLHEYSPHALGSGVLDRPIQLDLAELLIETVKSSWSAQFDIAAGKWLYQVVDSRLKELF